MKVNAQDFEGFFSGARLLRCEHECDSLQRLEKYFISIRLEDCFCESKLPVVETDQIYEIAGVELLLTSKQCEIHSRLYERLVEFHFVFQVIRDQFPKVVQLKSELAETEKRQEQFHMNSEEASILVDVLNRICRKEGGPEPKGFKIYRDHEGFIALDLETDFNTERQLVYIEGKIDYNWDKLPKKDG